MALVLQVCGPPGRQLRKDDFQITRALPSLHCELVIARCWGAAEVEASARDAGAAPRGAGPLAAAR
eukprot:2940530-Pyramimonas_sp.AAC.1